MKFRDFKEDNEYFEGTIRVTDSSLIPGQIQVVILSKDRDTGDRTRSDIRIDRGQARELAAELQNLADKLFFEAMKGEKL